MSVEYVLTPPPLYQYLNDARLVHMSLGFITHCQDQTSAILS